jgi:glycosyltransferase involved in cell wall biosynthesis
VPEAKSPHFNDFVLLRYVASDLDATEHATVSSHIQSCPSCQSTIREIAALDQELAELPKSPAGRAATEKRGARVTKAVLVVMPARNEAESIVKTIGQIVVALPDVDVLVVSDASTDRTVELAESAGATVVRLPYRLGYGGAVQAGFKYAVASGCDYILQMDADGQHDPSSAAALLAPVLAGTADVAIGSRFLGELGYRIPVGRRTGMRFFAAVASALTGQRFSDPTSGYQAMNRRAFTFFSRDNYPSDFPDADAIVTLVLAGFRVVEVPVRMLPRVQGVSMHSNLGAIYYVSKMILSILMVALRAKVVRASAQDQGAPRQDV